VESVPKDIPRISPKFGLILVPLTGQRYPAEVSVGRTISKVIAPYDHVDAMGAHITHRRRQAGCDLACTLIFHCSTYFRLEFGSTYAPVSVTVPSGEVHVALFDGPRYEYALPGLLGGMPSVPASGRSGGIGDGGCQQERRPTLTVKVSRQRPKTSKIANPAANGRLSIAARIPGKTNSRLKILGGGVRVIRGGAGGSPGFRIRW